MSLEDNDGIHLNVRLLVEARVLRSKFTVNWKKDHGKNPGGSSATSTCTCRGRRSGSPTESGVEDLMIW